MGTILPLDMVTLVVARVVSIIIFALGVSVMTFRRDQRETLYFCLALLSSVLAWSALIATVATGTAVTMAIYAGCVSTMVSLQWAAFCRLTERRVARAWFVAPPLVSALLSLAAPLDAHGISIISSTILAVQLAVASAYVASTRGTVVTPRTRTLVAIGYAVSFLAALLRVLGAIYWPDANNQATVPTLSNVLIFVLGYIGTVIVTLSWLAALKDRAESILKDMAFRDELTGLANRRVLYEQGRGLWERSRRQGTVFTLVLIDIDHFKSINDRWGHDEGDRTLRAFGAALAASRPRAEIAARSGGEEFCLIFLGADAATAQQASEDLRERLADMVRLPDGMPVRFSAGVAQTDPIDGTLEAVYSRADRALYEAKASGRDCAVIGLPGSPLAA